MHIILVKLRIVIVFKKIVKQLNTEKICVNDNLVSSPFERIKNSVQKNILKSMSEHALNLYQKKTDIKTFTKLALSDPQDLSHNRLAKETGLDEYDILFDLSNNEEFLKDLGL